MAFLALTLALLAMTVATTAITVPLDMALDSFDDQYQGCGPAMKEILPALNRSEFQKNPLFAKAWSKAVTEWQRKGPPETPLSSAQAIAIMAYLLNDLYEQFNEEVRVAGRSPQEYRDNFHFKTLHFLLTDALATLRAAQGQQCRSVSWEVCGVRFEARLGDTVRFSQFVPRLPRKTGTTCTEPRTLFDVHSCQSVELPEFSQSPEFMKVLIPPFETFGVIKVTQEGNETTIKLHPTEMYTKYNCEWLKGGSVPRATGHLGGLLLATTALAVATRIL